MTIILRDFSHWNIIYDYPAVRESADGFIVKSYDIEYGAQNPEKEDPAHDDHWFGLRPKPVAEYLYHDPSSNSREQVLGYMAISYRGFMDVLDVEEHEGLPYSTVTSRVIGCLENFVIESGRKAWIYSNLNFLDYILVGEADRIAELVGGIWIAWQNSAGNATSPRLPAHYPPELTQLWQNTWDAIVPGVQGPSDGNIWLGTDAEWRVLANMPPIPPDPPDLIDLRVSVLEEKVLRLENWGTSLNLES